MKPENLLLDHNMNIKIVDFGLSNTYADGETLETACGSPCYAAPEMISGKPYNGVDVDIWSCGVVLYAVICGRLPFEDTNTAELYKKILAGDYKVPKFLSKPAQDFIRKVLEVDPEKRAKIDDIASHPWFRTSPIEQESKGIIIGYNKIPVL